MSSVALTELALTALVGEGLFDWMSARGRNRKKGEPVPDLWGAITKPNVNYCTGLH